MIITILFFVASVGIIIFAAIYAKKKDKLYSFKTKDKQKLKGKRKNIKNIWGIEEIKNSMITGNGQNSIIIEIGSVEYRLLNEAEQDNIDNTLMKLSKIFTFQTQFFSTIEKIDTTNKIEDIRRNLDKQNNDKIIEYGESIIEYLENIMHEENLYVRKNYIIASSIEPYEKAHKDLLQFYASLENALLGVRITSKMLNDTEIIELIHRELNKNSTEKIRNILKEGGLELYVKNKEKQKRKENISR